MIENKSLEMKRLVFFFVVLAYISATFAQNEDVAQQAKETQQQIETLQNQDYGQPAFSLPNLTQQIEDLQRQMKGLQEQNQMLQKEVEIYRDDVRHSEDKLNDNMSHWLSLLTIIMALLGVLCPLVINRNHTKKIENQLNDAIKSAKDAKQQADDAREKVNSMNDSLRQATEQARKAEEAAKETEYNRLISDALNEKEFAETIKKFDNIIMQFPAKPEAYFYRGNAKSALGDEQGAIADYSEAIRINPQHAKAYYNLAICYDALAAKETDEMKNAEYLEKAAENRKKAKELE